MQPFLRACRLLLILLLVAAPALAAGDPAGFISELGARTLQFINQKQLSQQQREERFRELLREGFDTRQISVFVLGPYWRNASEQQRQEFMKLFEDYIVKAYTIRFSEYTGEQFKITGSRPEGDGTVVSSQIVRPNGGPPIRVDWRVVKAGEGFKIADVVVENISMIKTQKDEFAAVIQRNGGQLEALLKLLREKTRPA
jgi:phospholipid transport system substrate-binding protein